MSRDDVTLTDIADANGDAELVFSPTARQTWLLMSFSADGNIAGAVGVGGRAVGKLFRDTVFVSFFIATADTVEGVTIPLGNGRKFRAKWSGCVPGATVQGTIWYDDGQP